MCDVPFRLEDTQPTQKKFYYKSGDNLSESVLLKTKKYNCNTNTTEILKEKTRLVQTVNDDNSNSPLIQIRNAHSHKFGSTIDKIKFKDVNQEFKRLRLASCSNFTSTPVLTNDKRKSLLNRKYLDLFNANKDQRKILKQILKLNDFLQKTENKFKNQDNKNKIKQEWMILSKIIDRLLFFVFSILSSLILAVIIYQAQIRSMNQKKSV